MNIHNLNYKLHLETRICLQVLPSCSYPKSYLEVAQCISNVWILNYRFLAHLTHSSPDDDCLNLVLSLQLPELPLHSVTIGILCNVLDLSVYLFVHSCNKQGNSTKKISYIYEYRYLCFHRSRWICRLLIYHCANSSSFSEIHSSISFL
jgi:hypothetical protein